MTSIQQAEQLRNAMKAFALTAPDEQAATFPSLFPEWRVGETVKVDDRRFYVPNEKLYKAIQAHTTQADRTPDIAPALWAVIDAVHAGTLEDPIPASRGMEYEYGLYYFDGEDGKVYLCERTGEAAGGKIVLQYMPHEVVGNYFTLAS